MANEEKLSFTSSDASLFLEWTLNWTIIACSAKDTLFRIRFMLACVYAGMQLCAYGFFSFDSLKHFYYLKNLPIRTTDNASILLNTLYYSVSLHENLVVSISPITTFPWIRADISVGHDFTLLQLNQSLQQSYADRMAIENRVHMPHCYSETDL